MCLPFFFERKIENPLKSSQMRKKFAAILLMAGEGSRCKGEGPKQYRQLGDKMLYQYALETFEKSALFDQIILVSDREIQGYPYVPGGKTRQESSYRGLQACKEGIDYVVIHDAARPFVSLEILQKNVAEVVRHGAVGTAIASRDTMNIVEDNRLVAIPNRSTMWRGQTPQSFSLDLIQRAHVSTRQVNASDDCSLILELGHPVFIVEGAEENFKITTPFDALVAEFFLSSHIS